MGSSFACENYEVGNPFLQKQHQNWLKKRNSEKQRAAQHLLRINDFESFEPFRKEEMSHNYDSDMKEDEKYDTRNRSFLEETSGSETFSLVQKWATADPPIVILNPAFIAKIEKPDLCKDLQFQRVYAENAFTLLCKNLTQCTHIDAEEWKVFKQTLDATKAGRLKFEELDFDKEDEERRKNFSDNKILAENQKAQRAKLALLLRLCGGYRKYDKTEQKVKPVIDENKRDILVGRLYK
eukprot:UN04280